MSNILIEEIKEKTNNLKYNKRVKLFKDKLNSLLPRLGFDFRGEVLIKPNICVDKGYETGAITDPALVEALCKIIKQDLADPFVAESPVIGKSGTEVFEKTEYNKLSENIPLVDLCNSEFVSKKIPEKIKKKINEQDFLGQKCEYEKIKISKKALEADQIISVPSMKTHVLTTVTLSLKNIKGVLSASEKKNFHRLGLAQGVVCLNHLIKPDLAIVDGVIGQEGLGPINGEAKETGLIVIGKNPIEVDKATCKCMGITPDDSSLIKACEEVLENEKNESIDLNILERKFEKAGEVKNYEKVCMKSKDACSGCTSALFSILSRLEEENELKEIIEEHDEFVLHKGSGTEIEGKGFELAIGNCARGLKEKEELDLYLPGCPPIEILSEDAIRNEALGKDPINSDLEEIMSFLENKENK